MKRFEIFYILLISLAWTSCSKEFLEPEVTSDKEVTTSVNTLEDLQGLILGAYDRMNTSDYYGRDYVIFADVRSDNAFSNANSGRFVQPAQFAVNAADAYPRNTWRRIYQVISSANIIIGAEVENNDSDEVQYVKGQAHAIRALAYMDLLRLYGQQHVTGGNNMGVPIITEFLDDNIYPERAAVDKVWDQVETDLLAAENKMKQELDGSSPIFMTSWAALALQSRLYLYTKEWSKAATAAKKVIDSGLFAISATGNPGKGSSSSVFELAYTGADNEGINGLFFILQNTVYGDIEVTTDLYNVYEAGDVRRALFTNNGGTIRVTGKYNSPDYTDHVFVIRYEEVLLNYAEALINQDAANALEALNVVPLARNASPYAEATVDNLLLERRKELAMEGHRFFDLTRYGRGIPYVDPGQTFGASGIPYGSTKLAFPIPESEVDANPAMVQNKGY
ncbi:RagB/SusD family nutrient uptake outer membrane protein [Fulvivirga imtechensis]|nr:RagB/SusD family nutrient uptake outer membrane protein [Fulvivirga imtechensis]